MTTTGQIPVLSGISQSADNTAKRQHLMDVAQKLEATFLAEMLGHAGLGKNESEFSGGIGEEQFSSFLRQEQAKQMVRAGGIGLAEVIFNSMEKGLSDAGRE